MEFISDVIEFNTAILKIKPKSKISNMTLDEVLWTIKALHEEIQEFGYAAHRDAIVDQVDAIVDLMYFAIGALHKLGLTAEQIKACCKAVHLCNMTKKRGVKASRGDGSVPDAIKSDDWLGPEQRISMILRGEIHETT